MNRSAYAPVISWNLKSLWHSYHSTASEGSPRINQNIFDPWFVTCGPDARLADHHVCLHASHSAGRTVRPRVPPWMLQDRIHRDLSDQVDQSAKCGNHLIVGPLEGYQGRSTNTNHGTNLLTKSLGPH